MSVEDLDSFEFDMSLFGKNDDEEGFSETVSQISTPPTLYEILINSGKFTREQLEELNNIVQNKSQGVGILRDMMMNYVEAVNADSSNIDKKQEKLADNIKETFFLEKKGGRKKKRKRKTRRKHVENLRNVKEKQKEGGKREKQRKGAVVKTFHLSTQLLRLHVY